MKQILFILLIAFCTASCNDWLDVRPDTEQKEEDQFSSTNGFYDALVGCYMSMAGTDAYGERLSISNIEALTGVWYMPEESAEVSESRLGDFELQRHNYTGDNARDAIQAMYSALFNVIAQANMVIKYADENADVFTDKTALATVKGEAYAIRAYCQFDVLRLFGQMPAGSTQQVQLPYSYTTSIYEMPAYYSFTDYTTRLKDDLAQAEELLKDNDLIFEYTFKELNEDAEVPDDHMLFRQSRLNYWAVKALQARVHLYLGETTDAYRLAKEVIDAKGVDGAPVMELSGLEDFSAGYKVLPNECLFYLSKYDLMSETEDFLLGGIENARYSDNCLVLSSDRLNALYEGVNASSNRYSNWWNRKVASSTTKNAFAALKKYYWDEDKQNQTLYYQLVPMLRMSELYLIAMETSTDLAEVNTLYKTYTAEQGIGSITNFASLDEAKAWIAAEYPREFFGEGQSFYAYKRLGATTMNGQEATETAYVLPLPETEYNPNEL